MHVCLHTSLSAIVFACAMYTPTDDEGRMYLYVWALGEINGVVSGVDIDADYQVLVL